VDRGANNSVIIEYPELWYHAVMTNQSQDFRLLAFPGHPTWNAVVEYSDDNKYVLTSTLQ
jgi:hypothetical protein